ncbi:mannose-P-dolichol utilization defect 1 protein homolog [Anoplophora glabripennis]|uniref:mannose-P-dolichol utilization defect 1 protein homolog n=1 Tax=Anoplophora glabripennis TaxID=217634 RepID=UPI000874DEBD|nr:mannose-P-dolichol utilization defect 1 protein homolog [Anoplophora glabripennis]XP_018567367.1 mannose-P-dolichol utilization defect 1 protein homolog [Anoplophora glabripennis]
MNATATTLLRQVALLVFTPHCFDNYFIDFNYLDGPCFSATLSKCLGLGIILGSLLVKIPQILKLLKSKSGEGINILSVTLDLTAITIYMSYSFVKQFPFSSWGDTAFLAIQTVIVAVLVLVYQNAVLKSLLYLSTYLSVCYVMMSGITPLNVLWTLQTCNIPIVVTGKLIQAWTNFKNGHTGQLSAITMFMLFFGSAARIFTSIQETGDTVVILTYTAGTLANALLVSQMLFYWNVEVVKKKSE